MTVLNIQEIMRYGRQMLVSGIGESGQMKLKNASVLVVGAGGLGCPVLQYLSAAGVGTLGIADFDVVELHNLHRQILYTDAVIGKNKAICAVSVLKNLNPHVNYIPLTEKITASNSDDLFTPFDLIIDGSDNFATRYIVNDTCVRQGKPLIYGSIFQFEAQISVFNQNGSKNLRDLFPEPPDPDDVPNCNLNGVLGPLPGLAGSIMAEEALKLIMGLPYLKDELLIINTLNWEFRKLAY